MILTNADDWGRTIEETDAALFCYRRRRITSVSAMVFMEDSERASKLARAAHVKVGLHLNFSQHFTGRVCKRSILRHHDRIVRFLTIGKYAFLFYNPDLHKDFLYDYQAQVEEFHQLYGRPPSHFDGHQHMHLCTNMLFNQAIPPGERVRRSFSFQPGEKGFINRSYRRAVDMWLGRRYRLTDFFFALSQNLNASRLKRIEKLAMNASVELMIHPIKPDEFACLMSEAYLDTITDSQAGFICPPL